MSRSVATSSGGAVEMQCSPLQQLCLHLLRGRRGRKYWKWWYHSVKYSVKISKKYCLNKSTNVSAPTCFNHQEYISQHMIVEHLHTSHILVLVVSIWCPVIDLKDTVMSLVFSRNQFVLSLHLANYNLHMLGNL